MGEAAEQLIAEHRAAGRRFEADGVASFVREQGSGAPVVLLHESRPARSCIGR